MKEAAKSELAERVAAIVMEEAEDGASTLWHGLTNMPPRKVGESEALSRLWGYVYGVTAGLAMRDFGDLPGDQLAEFVSGVAVEVFRGSALVDLELIRLLENGRIDVALMTPETVEAVADALASAEAA